MTQRIKELRLQNKMTLLEVANAIGVSEGTVQRYESGNIRNLKYDTIVSLANALNTSPAHLMGWDTDDLIGAPALSDPEQTLVGNYRKLNAEGQEKLIDYSDDLVSSPKYKKCDIASVVEETA